MVLDSSDWEKLSSHLSSSSSDEEDGDLPEEEGWFIVKGKKQEPPQGDDDSWDADEDGGGGDDAGILYDGGGEEEERGGSLVFMQELLFAYLPELAGNHKIPLDYVEQNIFPHLPAKALLRLKPASPRWTRWISSDFFVHTHSIVSRSSVSGFFFHDSCGSPSFASFDRDACSVPIPPFSFLPEQVLVKSSNHGLVCCRGRRTLRYYVCNPVTSEWIALPPPANVHGPDAAVVIVMKEPLAYNFNADYHVVCAYEILEGVYGLESFSSETWEWRGCDEVVDAERIVPGSGVAASGLACWRTTMGYIVIFDPDVGACQAVNWPDEAAAGVTWEIGELGRRLCVVSVREAGSSSSVEVWVSEDGGWAKRAEELDVGGNWDVVPLRAQGEREVAVWDGSGGTVVAWDVERGTERSLGDQPGYCADFLPYLSSLVHVRGSQSQNIGKQNFDHKGKGIKLS